MFDMINEYFPIRNRNEQPIKTEHIYSIIEFQSLRMTNQLWIRIRKLSNKNELITIMQLIRGTKVGREQWHNSFFSSYYNANKERNM